jgi:AcrR family transcriptional regulator
VPWPKDRKLETRARILDAAASAIRTRGLAEAGVTDIMQGAGLTHGGFYSHFSSKDQLLAEALEHAGRDAMASLSASLDSIPRDERLHAVIDRYLTTEHAEHPGRGCPIAALAPELVRASPEVRGRLARAIRSRLSWLRTLTTQRQADRPVDDHAAGVLACLVGGVILARGLGGDEGRALLQACRSFIRGGLTANPRNAPRGHDGRRSRRAGGSNR